MLQVDVRLQRGAFTLQAAFAAPTPGVTALFGRSGCGKTTLVNLLAGLLRADSGRIALGDTVWLDTANAVNRPAEQRRVGYVFQDARLFPHYSVRGNLLYGAPRSAGDAQGVSRFDDVVALLGLESLLQRRPAALSGGERQRVALGRALLSQPQLLLLDEPLASLDASRRDEVLPYLERLRDHSAVPMVLVSHQFDEVLRLATHLVVLDQGCVTAAGDLGATSLSAGLRAAVGPDAFGAVLEGRVSAMDSTTQLADVTIGTEQIRVPARALTLGQNLRLHLLARDVILAVHEPRGLSVRNQLRGTVVDISPDGDGELVTVAVGNTRVLSRITAAARRELALAPGMPVWTLIKAVSVRPHATPAPHAASPAIYR
jgi:molybdate transport system ATP-binding protein